VIRSTTVGGTSSRRGSALVLGSFAVWACAGHETPSPIEERIATATAHFTVGPEQTFDNPAHVDKVVSPVVARSSTGFLVVYYDVNANPAGLYSLQLSLTGVPSSTPTSLGFGSDVWALASDGTSYLLVYLVGPYPYTVSALRLSGATGAPAGAPIPLPHQQVALVHKIAFLDMQGDNLGADVRADADLGFGLDSAGRVNFLYDRLQGNFCCLHLEKLVVAPAQDESAGATGQHQYAEYDPYGFAFH
jgi:hypothetical protein